MKTLSTSHLQRARSYVARIPGAVTGAGGHDQTFAVACALVHGFALSDADALALLLEYNATCQPPWSEAELVHKIQSAQHVAHSKPRGHLIGTASHRFERGAISPRSTAAISPKPKIDPATAVENYLAGFHCGEVDLWEASPVRPPDNWRLDALALLAFLFEPGERINFVIAFKEAQTKDGNRKANPIGTGEIVERDALIARWNKTGVPAGEAGAWLRMNPVNGRGVADANVTAFRFALVECDAVPVELQLSLFAKLPLPIAAILTSGGRSLHAWVKVDAATIEDYKTTVARLLALLSKFGVDGKNKNPSRLSRLPGVQRIIGADGDGRQRLLYLNSQPQPRRICES